MTRPVTVAAVDIGASGGRVIAGRVSRDGVELHEVSRFPNEPVLAGGTLYWDILRIYGDVLAGLRQATSEYQLAGVGIDSWGVDYGLLDATGKLLGNPVHYRDRRTDGVTVPVPVADLYLTTGIQHLPFNTIYQLAASLDTPLLDAARTLLLVPDLLGYWLTGSPGAEVTNASTTALLDVSSRTWAAGIIRRAGLAPELFPALRQPGDVIGPIIAEGVAVSGRADDTGRGAAPTGPLKGRAGEALPLIAVASHDTASAVVAVPADGTDFAYISSGTWSLVGMELSAPVLSEDSRRANFTNEAGIDGTVRYLRNVSGLWLLQECLRHWGEASGSLQGLLRAAASVEPLRFVVDADDPVFLPPGGMPGRIGDWLTSRGLPRPASPAEYTRCVLDSLALAYRRALHDVQKLSGRHASRVHVVGGGSRNELLCQLTADGCGLPVVAGPSEATALGNVLVQARALGAAPPTLPELRALLHSGPGLRRYPAAGAASAWDSAAARLGLPT